MEPGTAVFGYVVCKSMPDGSQIGGVLVTDIYGLPVEFRHTDPVLPSRLQRVLYGRSLDAYIANEVLVGALLSAVVAKPQLYVTGDGAYVDGAGEFGSPSAFVSESRTAQDKDIGHRHEIAPNEFILQLGPGNGAVRVKVGAPRGSSADPGKGASDLAARLLLSASASMEVLEPLERVSEAIDMLFDESEAKNSGSPQTSEEGGMKGLKVSGKVRDEAIAQVERLSTPATKLVKSLRRPNRSDANDLRVGRLTADFDYPELHELHDDVARPGVDSAEVLRASATVILNHKLAKPRSGSMTFALRAKGAKTKTAALDLAIRDTRGKPQVHSRNIGSLIGGRSVKGLSIDSLLLGGRSVTGLGIDSKFKKPAERTLGLKIAVAAEHDVATRSIEVGMVKPAVTKLTCKTMVRHKQRALTDSFFDHERRWLAEIAGLDVTQVQWVGLFRHVPIAAVASMQVDDRRGRLVLTLKDNASGALAKTSRSTVNIAMGRDVRNGALIQSVTS